MPVRSISILGSVIHSALHVNAHQRQYAEKYRNILLSPSRAKHSAMVEVFSLRPPSCSGVALSQRKTTT